MHCPSCAGPMLEQVLAAHMGAAVTLDACAACQVFWFDGRESLQLTPASTLRLFAFIGGADAAAAGRRPLASTTRCPRCGTALVQVEDRQRNTRFHYHRCPADHGRLITYFDFLREKHFVKALSPAQLADLRAHVQMVNCSNCGAPVDLAASSACGHCGSPLSMFDMAHAASLIDRLQDAGRETAPDPSLPLELLRARRQAERAFEEADGGRTWYADAPSAGTVAAGVIAFARWLRGR